MNATETDGSFAQIINILSSCNKSYYEYERWEGKISDKSLS
jgi:hypothetical protein